MVTMTYIEREGETDRQTETERKREIILVINISLIIKFASNNFVLRVKTRNITFIYIYIYIENILYRKIMEKNLTMWRKTDKKGNV